MLNEDQFILHGQYQACWWPGNTKNQGINSNGIDQGLLWHLGLTTRTANYNINRLQEPWKQIQTRSCLFNQVVPLAKHQFLIEKWHVIPWLLDVLEGKPISLKTYTWKAWCLKGMNARLGDHLCPVLLAQSITVKSHFSQWLHSLHWEKISSWW